MKKKTEIIEMAKRELKDYNQKEVEAFADGYECGDADHKENHKRPKEWYDERDKRRAENAPMVKAFVQSIITSAEKDWADSMEEFKDKVETHTLEVIIKNLSDIDSEEGNRLFTMVKKARRMEALVKREDAKVKIIQEDMEDMINDSIALGIAKDRDNAFDFCIEAFQGLKED